MRVARRRNPFEDHVYQAVTRYRQEGTRGIAWTYDHMSRADRAAFDEHLVAVKHPLAYQPGTNEERFRAYVIEVSKYPRRDNGLAGSLWRGARAGYHDYRAGALQARADAHRARARINPDPDAEGADFVIPPIGTVVIHRVAYDLFEKMPVARVTGQHARADLQARGVKYLLLVKRPKGRRAWLAYEYVNGTRQLVASVR